jgi:hypothetical protein
MANGSSDVRWRTARRGGGDDCDREHDREHDLDRDRDLDRDLDRDHEHDRDRDRAGSSMRASSCQRGWHSGRRNAW